MKVDRLTRLSAAAAFLLQLGTFVHASPMFTEHNNAADASSCQELRVTYPAGSAVTFEDNTKHLIAWIPPASLQQINITLANTNQETVSWVGLFDAQKGASGEVDVLLNGQQPGEYHFHLAAVGVSNCEVDSDPFQVTAPSTTKTVEQVTTSNIQQTSSSSDETGDHHDEWFTNEDLRTHVDKSTDEDKDHSDASEWFTNDDERTHLDKVTNEELDELVGDEQHSNVGEWFTNDDERTHLNKEFLHELENLQEANISHDDGLDSWIAEEIEVPSGPEWHDDSPSSAIPNHSNIGEWIAEELDQQHTDAEGFYVEEHVDDSQPIDIVDYTAEGSFAAEDIDEQQAEAYLPSHEDGWFSDDDKPFDHSNAGSFIAEEIEAENAVPSEHEDLTDWIAEEIDDEADHSNETWTDNTEELLDEPESTEDAWIEESEHNDDTWTDESPHLDEVTWIAEEVDENGVSDHPNDAHVDVDDQNDPYWHVDEEPFASWTDESVDAAKVPDHTDESPITWEEVSVDEEENSQDKHVDAVEQWIEETVHSDAVPSGNPSTGYMPQENTHNDSINAPSQPQNLVANW
ncbi:hypothetical protein BX666DRAFT_1912394 [Dichotomocladium elegans]|nr:hypothetical protein BX666DRAFT_1912394 [Dichotomocladium elegans]